MARDELSEQLVDALNRIFGSHKGFRAAHAKGTVCAGQFTPTGEAARLSTARHFAGEPVRATVRFSNGSGDPHAHDGARDSRGMATKLYVDIATRTDIVAVSSPVFAVRTPEDFLELLYARVPDPETGNPDLDRIGAFLGAHPESQPAIQHALMTPPPASYAQVAYHGLHAFRFVDADGGSRFVRYHWIPEAGVETLEDEVALQRERDYLQGEIAARMAQAPVAFRLEAQIAEDGDPIDDPTAAWPDDRERVELGRLEVTGPETGRETGDDVLVFDPTRVIDGIELSNDRILHARRGAYDVSVERRAGVSLES